MKKTILFIFVFIAVKLAIAQTRLNDNFLKHIGDSVVVTGKIYGGAFLTHVSTKPTFLNLGDTSPSHRLMIRIEPEDRDKFPEAPEKYFLNKNVSVSGVLQDYKGTPLINIREPEMIKMEPKTIDTLPLKPNSVYINKFATEATKNVKASNADLKSSTTDNAVINPLLQSEWIKSVAQKEAEETKKNVRIVQKDIALQTAPSADAPTIAMLHKGMRVSIIYTSKKWSFIHVGSIEGFNGVNGFIRHRRFRHLKKPAASN